MANIKHRMYGTSEYKAYHGAKKRCTDIKNNRYAYYGGRGIEFRFESFEEFYKDIGPKPSHLHSLDRKNTEGHYEVGNVKWSTAKEQAQNRRNTRLTKNIVQEIKQSLQEGQRAIDIAKRLDLSPSTIQDAKRWTPC